MGWSPGAPWETRPYTEFPVEDTSFYRGMSNGATLMGCHELDGVLRQSLVSRTFSFSEPV